MVEKIYHFELKDYRPDGVNIETRTPFVLLIGEWEVDFYEANKPFKANSVHGNFRFMKLLQNSFLMENNYRLGFDEIDGEIDLDAAIKMDFPASEYQTVYALGSHFDEDEALFLISDETLPDGVALMKYTPDADNDDPESGINPDGVGENEFGKSIKKKV